MTSAGAKRLGRDAYVGVTGSLYRARLGDSRRLVTLWLGAGVIAVPLLVPRGPGNSVPFDWLNIPFLAVGIASLWLARTNWRMPLALPYLLYLAGGILALPMSVAPDASLLALAQDTYVFVYFLVVANVVAIYGAGIAKTLAKTWIVTALAIALLTWLATFLYPDNVPSIFGNAVVDPFGRAKGTFRDPNMTGNYLVLSLFILWASPWPRSVRAKLVLSVPIGLAIYSTASNTALAAVLGGGIIGLALGVVRGRRPVRAGHVERRREDHHAQRERRPEQPVEE
jgi:hypothetical protein